jgi:hypothetical protein
MLGSPCCAVGFPARNVERISGEAPSKDMGKAALLGARAFSGLTILVTPTIHAKPAPLSLTSWQDSESSGEECSHYLFI